MTSFGRGGLCTKITLLLCPVERPRKSKNMLADHARHAYAHLHGVGLQLAASTTIAAAAAKPAPSECLLLLVSITAAPPKNTVAQPSSHGRGLAGAVYSDPERLFARKKIKCDLKHIEARRIKHTLLHCVLNLSLVAREDGSRSGTLFDHCLSQPFQENPAPKRSVRGTFCYAFPQRLLLDMSNATV